MHKSSAQNSGANSRIASSSRGIITPMHTIDIHAHWYPKEWLELLAKDGAAEDAALERTAEGGYSIRAKHISNVFDERFVDLEHRKKRMAAKGIDVHALSLTTPMVYWASPGFGLALSQAFNDAASAAHRRIPSASSGSRSCRCRRPSWR